MPIPSTATPAGLSITERTGGRWQVTCGRCLGQSSLVAAVAAADAWEELQANGWQHYVSPYRGSGYAICPGCAKAGPPEAKKRPARRKSTVRG